MYEYRIINRELRSALEYRYTWHVREPLDLAAMETAAGLFLGEHDFAAFRTLGTETKTTIRRIHRSQWERRARSARLPHRGKQLPAPDGALDGRGDGRGGTRPDERGGDKRAAQRWRPRRRAGGGASLRFVSRRGTLSTVVIPGRRWRRAGLAVRRRSRRRTRARSAALSAGPGASGGERQPASDWRRWRSENASWVRTFEFTQRPYPPADPRPQCES